VKKIMITLFLAVLFAGCTQQSSGSIDLIGLEDLSDLPSLESGGMPELESLPSTNSSLKLDTGLPESNPFPSMPEIE